MVNLNLRFAVACCPAFPASDLTVSVEYAQVSRMCLLSHLNGELLFKMLGSQVGVL